MAEDEGEDAPPGADGAPQSKQVYVRSNKLRTFVDEATAFFAGAVGKPTSITNKFGEVPPDGLLREVALVTFRKNKAVQKAIGLSGGTVGGKSVAIGLNTRLPQARAGGGCPRVRRRAAVRRRRRRGARALCVVRQDFVRALRKGADGEPTGAAFVIFEDADGQKAAPSAPPPSSTAPSSASARSPSRPPRSSRTARKHSKKKKGGAGGDGDGGAEERERKRFRPSEWRHDKATGLTLPRRGAEVWLQVSIENCARSLRSAFDAAIAILACIEEIEIQVGVDHRHPRRVPA